MDTYVYKFEKNLYINLTNRCSNNCTFCLRNNGDGIGGNKLWLEREPTAGEVIEKIQDFKDFDEAVFCGYGESTYRLNEIIEIGSYLKKQGYKTRLDTNGLGNLINGYDITKHLQNVIDSVSVSLNHSGKNEYDIISRSIFKNAFEEVIDFTTKCTSLGIKAIMTVVDIIGKEDIEKCKAIAASAGATLRVREYIKDNNQ